MKRLVVVFSIFILVITLSACKNLDELNDDINPAILGVEDVVLTVGGSFNILSGVTASDDVDGDITSNITYTVTDSVGNVILLDVNVIGVYYINYNIKDNAGNSILVTRKVTIEAEVFDIPPVITVESDIVIAPGSSFNPLDGVSASDSVDGNVSSIITFVIMHEGTLVEDYSNLELGVYQIIYTVVNSSGLTDEITRLLTVTSEVASDNVIHFQLDNIEEAKARIEQFFIDVLNDSLTAEEVCMMYIGDVPFPINNGSVEECMAGIGLVRPPIDSVSVTSIVEVDREGLIGYDAELLVSGPGINVSNVVEVAFLGYEGSLINYIHFLTDPFPNVGDPYDEELETAQTYLSMFYDSFFDIVSDPGQYCSDVLVPMNQEGLLLEDCEQQLIVIRDAYQSYNVNDITRNGEMVLPDQTIMKLYVAQITLSTSQGYFDYSVSFGLFGDPLSIFIIGDPFVDLDSIPDGVIGEFVSVPVEEVLVDMQNIYNALFNTMTPVDFCNYYMSEALGSLPDFINCSRDIEYFIHLTDIYDVLSIIELEYYYDGGLVTAYEVEISVVNSHNEFYSFYVYLGYIQDSDALRLLLLSNPFSYIGSDYNTVYASPSEAQGILQGLYGDMLNSSIDAGLVCINYIVNDPVGPTLEECIDLVNSIRTNYDVVLVQGVIDTIVITEYEILNGFTATIVLEGATLSNVFDVEFIIVGTASTDTAVFMGNPMGENEPQGSMYADINEIDAFNLMYQYYDVAVDAGIPASLFCTEFLPLYNDMQVMELGPCEVIRIPFTEAAYIFNVSNILFFPEEVDSPPYFTAEIVRSGPEGSIYYDVAFFFLLDEFGNILPATVIEQALGLNSEPEPIPSIFNGVPALEAQEYLGIFYTDVFGTSLTSSQICVIYFNDIQIPTPFTYEACLFEIEDVKALTTGYIINDIYVLVVNGQDHFVANVTLNTSLGNMTFDVEFALWGYPTGSEVLLEFVTTPFVIVEPVEYYFPPTATVPDATVRNEIELFYQFLNDPAFNEADFCYLFVILNNDYSFMDPPDCEGFKTIHNGFGTRSYDVGVITYNPGENGLPAHYIASVTRTIGLDVKTYDVMVFFFDDGASGFFLTTIGSNAIGENDLSSTG